MAAFEDKIQALMDEVYNEWQKDENNGKGKWDILGGFSETHQIAVMFGNFHYQVGNGGISQWISNGYFHDDAEKLTEYLEIGAETDERCRTILDKVYKLDQYAQETDCDRYGTYYDPDDDGDSSFLGDMINCDKFDTWYYAHCGKDDWWRVVSGIIDKAEARGLASAGQHEQEDVNINPPIQVYIENIHDGGIGGFTMPLPTTMEKLQPFLDGTEITGWQDMNILEVTSDIAGFGEILSEVTRKTLLPDTLDELNYLAAQISRLEGEARDIFASAIEGNRHCGNTAEIIDLTFMENLNRFELLPAFSNEECGDFLIENVSVDAHAEAFNRLEKSDNPDDVALAKHIEKLEQYVDREKYGRDAIKEENGVLTENGLLIGGDGIQSLYHGPQDIPAEHRIFSQPGESVRIPIKVEYLDAAETLIKLRAICDVDIPDIQSAVNAIAARKDYLLITGSGGSHLIPAMDVYKRGGAASEQFDALSNTPDTRFYAVHLSEPQRGITCDIIELNGEVLRTNATRHGISPERIDAVLADGTKCSYNLWEWANMPAPQREQIASSDPRFSLDNMIDAYKHFKYLRKVCSDDCNAVSETELVAELNSAYMAAAENPRSGMIRLANEAAREILAGSNADVYKLTANGPVKLASIEALRPLCFADHRETAIKREDAAALDKWAERTVKNIERQHRRDERGKAKNIGEEL